MDNEILYLKSKMDTSLNEPTFLVDRYHYQTPLSSRYASEEMSYNFSEIKKFSIWRWLWVYLAKAQKELGLDITEEMISEMQENIEDIDFDLIEEEEKLHRHDVIAHINEFASKCPKSAGIIHLGATSCFVGDNTDLIVIRDAFDIILPKLANCISKLERFSLKYKDLPTIGYTHLNPAQLVTVGKRSCLWMSDLLIDLNRLERARNELKFSGCKSNTGTQATFLELFKGDKEKVKKLDQLVTEFAGFKKSYTICGQTYSRKIDAECLSLLANFGVSVHKMCTDIRLLVGLKQIEEPYDSNSSVTAHKRNPLKSERCCSLSRHLFALNSNGLNTASVQWLERTMDDSAVRRITIPEAFLTADIILNTLNSLLNNLVVRTNIINNLTREELPFLINNKIIEFMVKNGCDENETRNYLNNIQKEANINKVEKSQDYNLIKKIESDKFFSPILHEIKNLFNPQNYIGCAAEQVEDFVLNEVRPALSQYNLE